jgi:hypothetical protein
MRVRIRSLLVICVLILSIFSISWTFSFSADTPKDNSNNGANRAPPGGAGYHWGLTQVIGEPVYWQNENINHSDWPAIAVEDDKVHVVWQDNTNLSTQGINCGGDSDIFYRHYDGTQWLPIEVVSEPFPGWDSNTGSSSVPDIAVENGNVYVVWYDYTAFDGSGTEADIFFRSKIGVSWGSIKVISEPVSGADNNIGGSYWPHIAVDSGSVYTVWYDGTDYNSAGTDYDIFYRADLGSGWEPMQVISEPISGSNLNTGSSYYPKINVENGNVYSTWYDYNDTNGAGTDSDIFFRCNLTGSSWEPVQVISEPVPGQNLNTANCDWPPDIAVENGNIYTVWTDYNNTNNVGTDGDTFYRCNITGSSWEPVQVISEPELKNNINTGTSWYPTISVEGGMIYVTWTDNNNTDGSGTDWDVLYRINRDGSWESIKVISEPDAGMNINTATSFWPEIAVDNGKSHIVWYDINNTDNSSTDVDIFYRTTFLPPELNNPKVTPTTGLTNTSFNFTVQYRDVDNEPPIFIRVRLNGVNHPMLPANPADNTYFNGKLYYYATTLDIGNIHNHRFLTDDGYYTKNTPTVNLPDVFNFPPEILNPHNPTATEDIFYETIFEYFDLDNITVDQQMTWKYDSDAPWLTFTPFMPNNQSAVLNGTPVNGEDGQYYVNITINDTMNETWRHFILTVEPVNR